jgi:predicted transcriptional regulator
MEGLTELMFELSNQDRLQILQQLETKPMKLTQISAALELTAQETSRHLTRLSKAMLIEKQPDGDYLVTEYGTQILHILPSLTFLLANRDYFMSHTLAHLPTGFAARIGELSNSERIDNAILLFQMVDGLVAEAEEHIWILSDQALSSTLPLLKEALERGIHFRTIMPKDMGPPLLPPDSIPDFSIYRDGRMENKHLDSVDIVVIVSEKRAVVSFPTPNAGMDYLGFVVTDGGGVGWVRDLFLYDWNIAVSI